MVNEAEQALGTFVRRYETTGSPRTQAALYSLLIATIMLIIAIPLVIEAFTGTPEAASLAGLTGGVGLAALYWGLLCAYRALFRSNQIFRVREGGLAYEHDGYFRLLPWSQIRSVTDRGQPNWVGELAGWDVYCVIRPVSGRRLVVTGHTKNAAELSDTLRRAVDQNILPRRDPDRR